MAKYVLQYYSKSSTISKDKELVSFLEHLESVEDSDKDSLREILGKTIENVIQKKSGLYKHSKNRLLKRIVKKEKDKNFLNFIKTLEKDFLENKITRNEFVDRVFKRAKNLKTYISRTHFLLYVKKLQEEKIISKIKQNPEGFLQSVKENEFGKEINSVMDEWLNAPAYYNKKDDYCFAKTRRSIYSIASLNTKNPYEFLFSEITNSNLTRNINAEKFIEVHILRNVFFRKNNNGEYLKLKQFLFKIINSEPITDKDIEEWTNLNSAIKSFNSAVEKFRTDYGVTINKDQMENFKNKFFILFRKNVLAPLRESFLNYINKNPEKKHIIENSTAVMPYYKELREISREINGTSLTKEKIKNIIFSSFNEKHEIQFFNPDFSNTEEIYKYIKKAKEFLNNENEFDKEILKELNNFELTIKNAEKQKDKESMLRVKESYETLKEKIFLYRKEKDKTKDSSQNITDPLFESFSNIRNAYKKTFFKSTDAMFDIYKKSGIADIKINIATPLFPDDHNPYLKFNPNSRVFEYYNGKNEEPTFSLPVSAVMNRERTAIKKHIYIDAVLSRENRNKEKKTKGYVIVDNYEEINKQIQKNLYSFKESVYVKKNEITKNKNENPGI